MEKHNFNTDVIKRSMSIPVLVDFWAPWCGACKVLSPTLELLHERHKGEWVLVKINVEKYPVLAERYKVSSIPTVLLFINGDVVDEFSGAIPGHAIESWLQNTLSARSDKEFKDAELLYINGKREQAFNKLTSIIKEQPDNRKAKVLLALLTVPKDSNAAREMVGNIEPVGIIGDMAEAVRVLSKFMETHVEKSSDIKSETADHFNASVSAFKSGDMEKTLQELIEAIKGDRDFLGGYLKDIFIALFIFLGEQDWLTGKYRRELAKIL